MRALLAGAALLALTAAAPPQREVPAAIANDPPPDRAHPAAMEVLHIPSGGVAINGVAYLPAGAGPHPVLVLFHGLPGNEKNLDLAHAVRRAGWTVVTLNYRGSWGSPGTFGFANCLADGQATLAFVRDPANAARLRADPARIVVAGHSMGGWVAARTAAAAAGLKGAVLISAADLGDLRDAKGQPFARDALTRDMGGSMETLAGTSPAAMADELLAGHAAFTWRGTGGRLARTPLLVLSSNDGLRPATDALAAEVRRAGGEVTAVHVATDHGWSDARVRLQAEVIDWLAANR